MRLVLATGLYDPLGGVFWSAYAKAGGPPLQHVFVVRGRSGLGRYRVWQQPLVPLLIFGIGGSIRLIATRARFALTQRDHAARVHAASRRAWPGTPTVSVVPSLNADCGATLLREAKPDLLVSVGLPEILKPHILEIPRLGAINVHNGRLPRFRGHLGTFWEVMAGESEGYVSIHEMAPTVDAGPLVAAAMVPIAGQRSFLDLLIEKKQRGGSLLAELARLVDELDGLPEHVVGGGSAADTTDYFGWPSMRDLWRFRRGWRSVSTNR